MITMKDAVLEAIESERAYQEQKWGEPNHSPAEWLLILGKVLADARRAWMLPDGNELAMHEIRQVAAFAVAAMEQCGAPLRAPYQPPSPYGICKDVPC